MPDAERQMPKKGKLVVITGPSGVGKSTIVRAVLRQTDARFSVSVTTRRPRPDEADGRDYDFVSRPEFEKMIADGKLLEWAEVYDQYYGTPARPVLESMAEGKTIMLEIDIQGGLQVHQNMPDATFVLLLPPNQAELKRRLTARASKGAEAVEHRFAKAREEILAARRSGIYTHTVVNDDLEQAIKQVVTIVTQE